MSGPKTYEVTYTPPPDMSATYRFDLDSAEEAAGVMAQLSALGSGVSVSVSGGRISVHVTDSAYRSGNTESAIRSRVNAAKDRYLQQLLKKRVSEAKGAASSMKAAAAQTANSSVAKLDAARRNCIALFAELNVSAATPFGSYNMSAEQAEVRSRAEAYQKEQSGIAAQKAEFDKRCDAYIARVDAARSAGEVSAIQRPSMGFGGTACEVETAALQRTMRDKKAQFKKYTTFLTELDRIIKTKGLEEYRSRIEQKVKATSMYSATAIDELKALVEQIENEKKYLLETEKLDRAESDAAKKIEAQLSALAEIKQLLKPLEADTSNTEGVSLDYKALCAEATADCESAAEKLNKREYRSFGTETEFSAIASELDAFKKTIGSPELYEKLKSVKARLEKLDKASLAECELYARFTAAKKQYADLYYRLSAITDEKTLLALDEPEDLVFAVEDAAVQTKSLEERNDKIKAVASEYEREVMFAAMSSRLEQCKFGKTFKKERRADGSLHIAYMRADSKGAIYDVVCGEGKMQIYPRGVKLSNGRCAISPEALKKLHGSCKWADELTAALAAVDIGGRYEELPDSERDKSYDTENYYVIKTAAESVRFLRENGFTAAEIQALGYRTESGGSGAYQSDAADENKAMEREFKK